VGRDNGEQKRASCVQKDEVLPGHSGYENERHDEQHDTDNP
jgi:hypothetical protein